MHPKNSGENFSLFETITAFLLGLAAVCTAISSFQDGQWNGKQVEAYGKANNAATMASSERARAIVEMARDSQIEVTASTLIVEANREKNPDIKMQIDNFIVYLYTRQLSNSAYKALGFPTELRAEFVTANIEETEKVKKMKDDLFKLLGTSDLIGNENYQKEMFSKSMVHLAESEKLLKEGDEAMAISGRFSQTSLLFSLSLFFQGIAIVFKSRLRWAALMTGALFLFIGIIFVVNIPWAL